MRDGLSEGNWKGIGLASLTPVCGRSKRIHKGSYDHHPVLVYECMRECFVVDVVVVLTRRCVAAAAHPVEA